MPDDAEIGALWSKQGPHGEYLTGTIAGQRVVVFRNRNKREKGPDWRVLKAIPRPDRREPDEEPPF